MQVRTADQADLASIVALLADEQVVVDPGRVEISEARERAFAAILADARNAVLVLDDERDGVIGCVQITLIPGLGRDGGQRAHLEAIRVRADRRGTGLGRQLLAGAIAYARAHGCTLVQLMSNRTREDAHRFYASLGFTRSHDGFKLDL